MNLIWNKNLSLFKERFFNLYSMLEQDIKDFEKLIENTDFSFSSGKVNISSLDFFLAKNNSITCQENNLLFHSKYNPQREAQNAFKDFNKDEHKAAVFFSEGAGYLPVSFASMFPQKDIILIEDNPFYLFASFLFLDWTPVFSVRNLFLIVKASYETAAAILRKYSFSELKIYAVNAHIAHNEQYYKEINKEIIKHKQTEEINSRTLEKFSLLWTRNSLRNINQLSYSAGVKTFFNKAPASLPFLILAAGPSLETVLPYLKELNKRCVTICVETALHSVLRCGVEPDFIILVDPQYACAQHIHFLSSPSSIMIAEEAVYPSVFRFNCKKKILCSSMYPIGKFFESRIEEKGALGQGGSVTTTAWDFARKCGAKEIYIAGMDLGFPDRQTHIKGSQFEERSLRNSNRLNTEQNANVSSLLSANPEIKKDYNGKNILTDSKMSLFSWWFQNNCANASLNNQNTFTLTPQSLAIPGINVKNIKDILTMEPETEDKKAFLSLAEQINTYENIDKLKKDFTDNLLSLRSEAKKGIDLCKKALKNPEKLPLINNELDSVNNMILNSSAKECASLVFPTKRQLEQKTKDIIKDSPLSSVYYSRVIYTELLNSIDIFFKYMPALNR